MTANRGNRRASLPDIQPPRRNDVRVLSTEQAKAILFPRHAGSPEEKAGYPPRQTWQPWTAPSPRLPVDDEISALIEADRIIKPNGHGLGFGDCPYYAARLYMAIGAGRASKQAAEVRRRQKDLGPKADAVADHLSRLADLTGRLLAREGDVHDILRTGTSAMGEWHDLEALESDAKALMPLFQALRPIKEQIASAAKRMSVRGTRITPQHAPGDPWNISWVFTLNRLCCILTGKPICKDSGLSCSFISSAYLSIGGENTSSNDWVSAVATVHRRVAKLPSWEQEALTAGYFAPKHVEAAAALNAQAEAYNEARARQIVADAQASPENIGWIATGFYESAPPKVQRLIDALGWTAERRAAHPAVAPSRTT